jgi:hypothetical protein
VTLKLRRSWKRVVWAVGNMQARILLTIFYALVMFPFGVAVRLFFDPLRMKQRPTQWLNRPEETLDLPWARRQ